MMPSMVSALQITYLLLTECNMHLASLGFKNHFPLLYPWQQSLMLMAYRMKLMNGYSKKGIIRHYYTEDYKSIQFPRELHACANNSYHYQARPNAWVRGEAPKVSDFTHKIVRIVLHDSLLWRHLSCFIILQVPVLVNIRFSHTAT